jgi:uncharacterized protein DUF5681
MTSNSSNESKPRSRSAPLTPSASAASGEEYKVGPGRPPKEYRFKPGQSGNPKGRKPKPPSIAMDLKALFDGAFGKGVTIKQGEKEQIITRAAAGLEQLSIQFAKGDRHARRDAFMWAEKVDSDLLGRRHKVIQEVLSRDHQAILDAYVAKRKEVTPPSGSSPVFAPPELLDDDPTEQG